MFLDKTLKGMVNIYAIEFAFFGNVLGLRTKNREAVVVISNEFLVKFTDVVVDLRSVGFYRDKGEEMEFSTIAQ